MANKQEKNDLKVIQQAVNLLSEHFDNVQVFANKQDLENYKGTVQYDGGVGNFFSIYGQIMLWKNQVELESLQGNDDEGLMEE
jgi:hypothetical protein